MVTDPISDFIIQLQNASRVGKERIRVPLSRMKLGIAQVLAQEGYVERPDALPGERALTVALRYPGGKPAIRGVKRISKPSRRMYRGVRDIHSVKRGHGLLVLSTPQGIMTGAQARQKRVGGEALFEIW